MQQCLCCVLTHWNAKTVLILGSKLFQFPNHHFKAANAKLLNNPLKNYDWKSSKQAISDGLKQFQITIWASTFWAREVSWASSWFQQNIIYPVHRWVWVQTHQAQCYIPLLGTQDWMPRQLSRLLWFITFRCCYEQWLNLGLDLARLKSMGVCFLRVCAQVSCLNSPKQIHKIVRW